jgi:2'-5' RNA ligase
MRVFVALDLPSAFTEGLRASLVRLRAGRRDLRWTAPDAIHLTLAFLGEIPPHAASAVLSAAEKTAAATPSFELSAARLIALPRPGAARVLAAGIGGGSRECAAAARRFEDELELARAAAGLAFRPRERRPFRAHATAARSGKLPMMLSEEEMKFPLRAAGRAVSLTVWESVLGRDGARYSILGTFPLSV